MCHEEWTVETTGTKMKIPTFVFFSFKLESQFIFNQKFCPDVNRTKEGSSVYLVLAIVGIKHDQAGPLIFLRGQLISGMCSDS
jgi:hypothetical protein